MMISKINSRAMLLSVAFLPLLSACQEADLQGYNPQEYYTAHPVENKIQTKHSLIIAEFEGATHVLSGSSCDAVTASLQSINPHAVQAITIRVPVGMAYRKQRVASIKKLLHKDGFNLPVRVISSDDSDGEEVIIDITHSIVVAPNCPDWRKSPVTTYSNMTPANFGCSAAVNLGLMVDDPMDLVRGRDSRVTDSERDSKVLTDYRAGVATPTSTLGAATGQ